MQAAKQNPKTPAATFGLSTLMLAVALSAVWFALLRASPAVGIAVTPVVPALIALGVVMRRWRNRGARMRPGQVAGTLGWLVFISYIWTFLGGTFAGAFFALCSVLLLPVLAVLGVNLPSSVSGGVVSLLVALLYCTVMIIALCAGLRSEIKEDSPPSEE